MGIYILFLSLFLCFFNLCSMLAPTDLPASPTSLNNKIIFEYNDDIDDDDVSSVSYRALPTGSDTSSVFDENNETKVVLPAMEIVIRNLGLIQQQQTVTKPHVKLNNSTPSLDMETNASSISQIVNIKHVPINHLGPREQEEAGK